MKIFDEKKYAEEMIAGNGFPKKKISTGELAILAKYYCFLGDIDRDSVENKLVQFCEKNILEFNYVLYFDIISKAIKTAFGHKLRIPENVPITKKEMDSIISIRNYRYEKVVFVMLAIAKYYKMTNTKIKPSESKNKIYYLGRTNPAYIFRLAHTSQKKNENILHILYKMNMIGHNVKTDSYFIKFTDADSLKDGDVEIYITDMNNIIDFYIPHCINCGKVIENKNKKQMYCDNCSKPIRNRNYYQKTKIQTL